MAIIHLIDLALEKQNEIYKSFLNLKLDIMPLILIQLKNKNEEEYEDIYKYLLKKLRKEEIGIRLDKVKENIQNIEDNSSKIKVMIMKQATSVGWDCPRAKILVKMRENMNDIFTIQTIGRIRRSINATHYPDDILNTSFLYTYDKDKTLLKRLFFKKILNKFSILKLNRSEFTAFVINNKKILKEDVYEAIKSRYRQLELNEKNINKENFTLPLKTIITILDDKKYKKETNSDVFIMKKNVYNHYPSNVNVSTPEAMFLEYAEKSDKIKWIYINGESDSQYFSILYLDNDKKYNTFYPDFILEDINGQVWIIETKGGENYDDSTRNIDRILTPIKYSTLQRFCKKNNLKYAFVRDKILKGKAPILKILYNSDIYIDSLEDEHWKNINDIL